LVFVTHNRIRGLWEKYAKQQVTLEDLRDNVISDGEDDVEDGDDGE